MKKTLSLLLALLMLATLFVPVSAADTTVISPEVLNSITEEEETGLGVAFLYTMNLQNTQHYGTRTFVSATAAIDGADYEVVKMGAIVANTEETGKDADAMVRENATGVKLLDVEAKKLWDWDDTYLSFAVRITNVPTEAKKTQIYARPYFVYQNAAGEEVTVYGDITNKSYFSGWCDAQPEVELPAIGTDIDITKKKNRIRVSKAEIVDRTVSLTFQNYTSNWITEETDYVKWTAYDASGKSLKSDYIYIGCIDTKKNKIKTFTFDVPDATARVKLTSSSITYWTEWA